MSNSLKIHAFRVNRYEGTPPLETVLSQIASEQSLERRIRIINRADIRADACELRNGYWFLDFVRFRQQGPGRVGRDSEIEGFEFEEDQGFGEETGALFDPATGYILIQYNHYGVRAPSVADYFCAFDGIANNVYSFVPKYDEDVERRLTTQGITRKISFGIDISRMSQQDLQRGRSLSEALEYGRGSGADKIKIEISVQGERSRGLSSRALETIGSLLSINSNNPDIVTSLEVSGKENAESVTEVLDLIAHRLCIEFNDLHIGADLRYAREDRWARLQRARSAWERLLNR